MARDYKWREIEDLPQDYRPLTNNELRPLHRIWMARKADLADEAALADFDQKIRREWAIETGIIEGVYAFDRGVTASLIEHGINPSLIPRQTGHLTPEHVAMIIEDHAEVLDWLFDFVKGDRKLTTSYIKELHGALLRHQETTIAMTPAGERIEVPLVRGDYKTLPNNPTIFNGTSHEYCPPEHVAAEMDRLIAWHEEHLVRGVPSEVEAAWIHHRFTQIHPFQDGNGRVARAIASLIFIKDNWFPLLVRSDEKAAYLDQLELADQGNLEPLVSWFSGVQKRLFLTALDSTTESRTPATIDSAVEAARDFLIGMGKIIAPEWAKSRSIADALFERTKGRINHTVITLIDQITSVKPDFKFSYNWHTRQTDSVVQIADELHYSANLEERNLNVALALQTPPQSASLVVSFHGVGRQFRGILAASTFLEAAGKATPSCKDFFQINYEESLDDAQRRFDPWLEDSIARGLAMWQRTLI